MNSIAEKLETGVEVKNILFATDFSAISQAALPYVTALSVRYGSTIHVAHVLPPSVLLRPGAPDPAVMGSIYEEVHSAAQEKMQHVAQLLRGFPHKTYVRHGDVVDVIRELIVDQEIDMLVLGTHGRTGLGRLIMGSFAEEIFRFSGCPVFTIGPHVPATTHVVESRHTRDLPPPQVAFRQILFATDFAPHAAEIASYAVSLAQEFRTQLTLLHVIDGYGEDLHEHPGPIDVALHKLEELVPDHNELLYRPEFVVEFGTPAEQILRVSDEFEADLIVLGARAAEGNVRASTHFAKSTAHKVVVGAHCPVLTIRH